MVALLFLLSLLAFVFGAGIFSMAKSAIHEIEGFLLFIISSILLVGAAIIEALKASSTSRVTSSRTTLVDSEREAERKRMKLDI